MEDPNASAKAGFELIMREGVHPSRVTGKKVPPPPNYEEVREHGLHIARNLPVHMRDGTPIFVDIYRPDSLHTTPLPILLGWSPYGKHNTTARLPWPAAGVADGWISPYTAFEAPDPLYWCPRGYAVVYPDPRGSWYSQGELRHGGLAEAQDCSDLIEWLGELPWTNGKVGMTGVSYLAAIQWQVGPLRPRHLAAINPWEGFNDWYREFALHGGIPETSFLIRGSGNLQWSTTRTEDTPANARAHPLYDAYWKSKESDLEEIVVPAYVVASWSDQGLHTRGTLEGFKRISSPEKWLEVHGRKKWSYYYQPSSIERQRQFFEHYLKRRDTLVPAWPKVLIEIRERANVGEFRAEQEWPLARTDYQRLYLDAPHGTLVDAPVTIPGEVRYDPTSDSGRATFDHIFSRETELTGHMKLRLWVEAVGARDMDLFVAVQKLDRDGSEVPFVFYALLETGPAALGWLRVSHREIDEQRSTPEQPVHPHTSESLLRPGERVAVEIEIWPSSTTFAPGQGLRVVVQGKDIVTRAGPNSPLMRHEETRNQGMHVIHTGGVFDSHLLVPSIPRPPAPLSQAITDADFRNYIAAFNRNDFEAFGNYYASQIHFQGQAGEFHSRTDLVSFYRQVKTRLRETIRILCLVVGEQDIVAELETELYALEDWLDFATGPIYQGETRRSQNFVWYEIANGLISSIRSARYRSFPQVPENDTAMLAEPAWINPPAAAPQTAMSAEHFCAYIDAFNRDDSAIYGDYYDENVILVLAGKTELRGRQAIFDFYTGVKAQTRRTLQINKFLATPNHLAVELESEFLALQDLPEFTAGPMRKGGRIFINTFVLYDLHDGKFTQIRSAQFRKIARP